MKPFAFGLILPLLVHLLQSGIAQAVAPVVQADPGELLVVPVEAWEGSLEVEHPDSLQLLGIEKLSQKRFLVSFYIPETILAGEYWLRFVLKSQDHQVKTYETKVSVPYRPRVQIVAPEPPTGTLGKVLHTSVILRNEGNASDRFYLVTSGNDPVKLEPVEVELGPGEEQAIRLTLQPAGTGERFLIIKVYSNRANAFLRSKGVAYYALPYAGADPNRPSLTYRIPLTLGLSADGIAASASTELAGQLSDFAVGSAQTRVDAQGSNLAFGLKTANWAFGLGYSPGKGARARLDVDPYRFSFRYDGKGTATWTAGFRYGAFSTVFTQRRGSKTKSQVDFSYRFGVAPGFGLSPHLAVELDPQGRASFGIDLSYANAYFLAEGRMLWRPNDQTWHIATRLASTAIKPYAGTLTFRNDPQGASLGFELKAATPEATVRQVVQYSGDITVRLDGRWLTPPYTTYAKAYFRSDTGNTQASLWLASIRREAPWTTRVALGFADGARLQLSQSRDLESFTLGGIGQLTLKKTMVLGVGARLGYRSDGVGVVIGTIYDLESRSVSGTLTFAYAPDFGPRLGAEILYDPEDGLQWNLGAELSLEGGFEVPPPVIDFFGGRNLGTVEGQVLYRNTGVRGLKLQAIAHGEPLAETTTDAAGHFRFMLPPGTYRLQFLNLPPSLTPVTNPVRFEVRLREQSKIEVGLRESLAIVGQVYVQADNRKKAAPFVWVKLEGETGSTEIQSDEQGRFIFRDLLPGTYRIFPDPRRLPIAFKTSTPPQTIVLRVGGDIPTVPLEIFKKKPTLLSTLTDAELMLSIQVEPTSAPRGAEIDVRAVSPGAHRVIAYLPGGPRVQLDRIGTGNFQGKLPLTTKAKAVFLYVEAQKGRSRRTLRRLIRVTEGPLAKLSLSDAAPFAGDTLEVRAHFLYHPESPYLVLGKTRVPLKPQSNRTYLALLTVPDTPGTRTLELWDGQKRIAQTVINVLR